LKDLIKFVPALKTLPWPKLGYILALALLAKGVVTFDQAILLVLLAWVTESYTTAAKSKKGASVK